LLTPRVSSSLPTKKRKDSSEKDDGKQERTEVWYDIENIMKKSWEVLSSAKISSDYCHDSRSPATLTTTRQLLDMIIQLNKRGVRQRFITDITHKNIKHCKELTKYVELRHLDGITGNFGIVDRREYGAAATIYQKYQQQTPVEFIYSNVKVFVEQQQYLFDMLWNKAIPAKERFKEIEQDAKREFVETIRDPSEIQKLGFDLIKAAEEEILVLFSTANAFRREEKAGALELLKEAAKLHGIRVRILVPMGNNDNNNDAISERIQQIKDAGIDIRIIKQTFQNKLSTVVVDQSLCLTVELKDDTLKTSDEAIGLATYSNSGATVFTYVSIFENLWIQTELHH
jgi:two-component system, OmpR family, sensor histidine kinase VicK